jgi:hypothetical protein
MSELLPLSAANLREYPWQALIAASSVKRCDSYFNVLFPEADKCHASGDAAGERVYRLLAYLTLCRPRYDNPKQPFAPGDGSGGASPETISKEDLQVLSEIRDEILDPDFRSRVADILWECRSPRSPKDAEIAVAAYLESSSSVGDKSFEHALLGNINRAWILASRLGRDKPLFLTVVQRVEEVLAKNQSKPETGFLCLMFLGLLAGLRKDPLRYAQVAESIARSFEQQKSWDFASRYWRSASEFYRHAGDDSNRQRAELSAAECWPQHAEGILAEGKLGAGAAAHWMSVAVHALRNAKADPARIQQVHLRLIELQNRGTEEMKRLTINGDDLPGIADAYDKSVVASAKKVANRPFEEAIFIFGGMRSPVDPDQVRKMVEEQAVKFVFLGLFPAVVQSTSGRIEDHSPSMTASNPALKEEATQDSMFIQCKMIYWDMEVKWKIDPARRQILQEHPSLLTDLAFLVIDNPLIPQGHEGMYLQGIHAGLHGDMLTAMHLLIPQLEASIRMVFQERGIITSTLESDSTQGEKDLGWLLNHPEMAKIFGNAAFSLRGILIHRFGYNLRNNMAHGLISEDGFYTSGSVYLWWLIVRLLCQDYRFARAGEGPQP